MEQRFTQWVLDLRLPEESRHWSHYQFERRQAAHIDQMRSEMQAHLDAWTEDGWDLAAATEQTTGNGQGGIDVTRFTFFWRKS
jgi:hypothetical protein